MKAASISVAILLVAATIAWFVFEPSVEPVEPAPVRTEAQTLYEECVAARDHEIHKKTFATIDNPDVQREILATQKEIAKRECREKYPNP